MKRIYKGIKTFDNLMTFDGNPYSVDQQGNAMGRKLPFRVKSLDGKKTFDSTGAFLVGELERLDQTLNMPLASVTWGRDIDLREDVTIADEVTSFTRSQFAAPGSLGTGSSIGNGKSWAGKNTTQISSISVDIEKKPFPLVPWAMELKYTILELESAARIGRPVDSQLYEGMQLKHQMDIDEQVYIGDTPLQGQTTANAYGLLNQPSTVVANVTNVATVDSNTTWAAKLADPTAGPDAVLADINEIIESAWSKTGYAVMPNRLLIPPAQFGLISTAKVSSAGNVSVIKYILENNVVKTSGKGNIEIFPVKWAVGAGASGTIGTINGHDRMVAYTKDKRRVRFSMTMLQRTPVQYEGLYHKTTYFCRLGVVEPVYPECIAYRDGL